MALKKSLLDEPKFDKQCAWNDLGYRCQDDGHLSQSVNGGGPWYCRAHFADITKRARWTAPSDMRNTDEHVQKLVPRIDGESEHDWSMRCRDWALARIGSRQDTVLREPGEDIEEAA